MGIGISEDYLHIQQFLSGVNLHVSEDPFAINLSSICMTSGNFSLEVLIGEETVASFKEGKARRSACL